MHVVTQRFCPNQLPFFGQHFQNSRGFTDSRVVVLSTLCKDAVNLQTKIQVNCNIPTCSSLGRWCLSYMVHTSSCKVRAATLFWSNFTNLQLRSNTNSLTSVCICIPPQLFKSPERRKNFNDLHPWKLTCLAGKSPKKGNTSTHSWWIFQPAHVTFRGGVSKSILTSFWSRPAITFNKNQNLYYLKPTLRSWKLGPSLPPKGSRRNVFLSPTSGLQWSKPCALSFTG